MIPLLSLIVASWVAFEDQYSTAAPTAPVVSKQVLPALKSGVDWLLSQQSSDGGWHSETYGNMKGGVGNTALVLAALSQVPGELDPKVQAAFERGVNFLIANLDEHGLVRAPDHSADYPVYATALVLTALERRPHPGAHASRPRLCQGLLLAQRSTANGWPQDHPDSGGWGILGGADSRPDGTSPSNISVTAHVLAALSVTKTLTPTARTEALEFLARCQNLKDDTSNDGGFVFTPRRDDPLNKARVLRTEPRGLQAHSYRTATYDGVLSLLACGISRTDSRLKDSHAWLLRDEPAATGGTPENDVDWATLRKGLEYYEAAAAARLYQLTADPLLARKQKLQIESLLARQRTDGSWSSQYAWMREDDPLIATALMVSTLAQTFVVK